MQINQLTLSEVNQFSSLFLGFIQQVDNLKIFSGNFADIQGFNKQIADKKFDLEKRKVLVETLKKQYKNLPNQPDLDILLDENTFTVTTGHQLNIFTGPLYVVFKMITTINLAKKLKSYFPDYNFVPIYWMASEDHDFAEINHFSLFGKNLAWETTQKGAVGRMNPNELEGLISEMLECPEIFKTAYLNHETLADAARCYAHELFGNQGLVCIDADDRELKRQFIPIIKNDLLENTAFKIVSETTKELENLGYKTQIAPREINFFYLADSVRERITKEGDLFKVLNTDIEFSESEILNLLETEPERFSPNVVLRPVYEEVILPNLAYIGGPSEVPYWLQLKGIFDFHQVEFPILMPRNFGMIINKSTAKRIEKLGLSANDLFLDEITLKKNYVERNSQNSLSLSAESQEFISIFDKILEKSIKIDKTLEGAVKGEQQKVLNALENLEKRLKKAEERNQETEVNQLLGVKQKLFPNGVPQERAENFLNFYLNNPDFLNQVAEAFDPLDFSFNVLVEEN
jgi:bacillithiol synthase